MVGGIVLSRELSTPEPHFEVTIHKVSMRSPVDHHPADGGVGVRDGLTDDVTWCYMFIPDPTLALINCVHDI